MGIILKKAHHFSSHIPALIYALERTNGDVLELGTGIFSTPFLHYWCDYKKRNLVSVENDLNFYNMSKCFEGEFHKIFYTENWDTPYLECSWDIVFIDHAPPEQRRVDLMRFSNLSKYIIVHDTNGRQEKHYHLSNLWKEFKYIKTFNYFPMTTIVSNFYELKD